MNDVLTVDDKKNPLSHFGEIGSGTTCQVEERCQNVSNKQLFPSSNLVMKHKYWFMYTFI